MNLFENSAKTPDNNSSKRESLAFNVEKNGKNFESPGETALESENFGKSISEKSKDFILRIKRRNEKEMHEKGVSFEKIVGKSVLGFAVASVLMASPQFNYDAMGADEDITVKLNQEFSDFADNNLAERISAVHQGGFVNPDYSGGNPKEKFKKDAVIQFLKVTNNLSTEDAENAYRLNKVAIDGKLKDVFGDGETVSSIDLLSEGGVMVSFSGNLENIGDIPAAFIDNLKEIKDNPGKFISNQILNVLVVDDAKRSAGDFINKHTVDENVNMY